MRKLLLAFVLALPALTQQAPDCQFSATFTGTGFGNQPTNGFPNFPTVNGPACRVWAIQISPTGFSALSIQLEGAGGISSPGSYSAAPSSVVTEGTNPITDATCAPGGTGCSAVIRAMYPWNKFHVTSVTGSGTILATAYGYRGTDAGYSSSGGSSSPTSNVNLAQVAGTNTLQGGVNGSQGIGGLQADGAARSGNPVPIAGKDANANARVPLVDSQGDSYNWLACNTTVEVALSGTSYTQIVAASGSTVIQVCKILVTSSSGGAPTVNTFTVAFGACAGSTTEKMNVAGVTGLDSDFGGALRGTAGDALCVKEAVSQSDKVTVSYGQAVW